MEEQDRCEVLEVHQEAVKKLEEELPPEELLYDLAELFKVFGDSTRIKILYALFEAELCVCDIAQALGMTQTAVSHQLGLGAEFFRSGNREAHIGARGDARPLRRTARRIGNGQSAKRPRGGTGHAASGRGCHASFAAAL